MRRSEPLLCFAGILSGLEIRFAQVLLLLWQQNLSFSEEGRIDFFELFSGDAQATQYWPLDRLFGVHIICKLICIYIYIIQIYIYIYSVWHDTIATIKKLVCVATGL